MEFEKPCIRNDIVIEIDLDQYRHALKESALLTEVFELHQGLIDLRAPIEFKKGTLPGAVNIPMLEDAERETIGKVYKEKGKYAALKKGFELVSGPKKKILIFFKSSGLKIQFTFILNLLSICFLNSILFTMTESALDIKNL